MALDYGFRTPRDLYEKLKRDATKLDTQVSADDLFNFAVTAWHMQDWIREGPAKSSPAIEADRTKLRGNKYVQMCRDIANASKHFTLTYIPTVSSVSREGAFTVGRSSVGGSDMVGGRDTYIIHAGSDRYGVGEVVREVLQLYEAFLNKHSL
jgi:hypothetical protein